MGGSPTGGKGQRRFDSHDELIKFAVEALHSGRKEECAAAIAEFTGTFSRQPNEDQVEQLNFSLLQWALDNGRYYDAAAMLWPATLFNPRPQSTRDVWELWERSGQFLLQGAASMCLSPTERCRVADGSVKMAREVVVGDYLCGDDGAPRVVLHKFSGRDQLYRVTPAHGPAFDCTENHMLTLICTWTRKNGDGVSVSSGYTPGSVIDVPLKDYLGWSRQRRRAYRLFYRECPLPERDVPVDPYILGAWLGDGTSCRVELCTPRGPMSDRWCEYWRGLGYEVVEKPQRGCSLWRVPGDGQRRLNHLAVVGGEKRVPEVYKQNSLAIRLAVLAGLLDADGTRVGASFNLVTKFLGLATDVVDIARSCGFTAKLKMRRHRIKKTGFAADYYHIFIRGDFSRLPLLEKPARRGSGRYFYAGVLTDSFTVEPLGAGEYAGFELDGNHRFLLESGIVTHNSKSFSIGVRLLLEWVRDPEFTTIKVLGPSESHLEDNLFSHLVELHRASSIRLPGVIQSLYIGLDARSRRGSISGVVVPLGKKSAAKLQGTKRFQRPAAHPKFGLRSRMFVFMDEVNKIPPGIWSDVDNLLANDDGNPDVFKVGGAYNPQDVSDQVGVRAEPETGWDTFDIDRDFSWKSKRGWDVLRLDALRCENIVQKRTIYPGLQTLAGMEKIIQNSGGYNTAGYYSMVRAAYPPQGQAFAVISQGALTAAKADVIWAENPHPAAGADIALEGSDRAVFALGEWGLARGLIYPPSVEYPRGKELLFQKAGGVAAFKRVLHLKHLYPLPKGETVTMANQIRDLCKQLGVRPEWLCVDRTGNGSGVHDHLKRYWNERVRGVNFYEGAGEKKIFEEDLKTPKDEYERAVSEMWFATQKFLEFDYLIIDPALDTSALYAQLCGRLFVPGKKTKVESKKEYMSRGNESPHEADAVVLLVHAVRMENLEALSMNPEPGEIGDSDDGDYFFVDPSNLYDYL